MKRVLHGATLGSVFETLWRWGAGHLARTDAPRGTQVVAPRRGLATAAADRR
jgi:hypothetical protein